MNDIQDKMVISSQEDGIYLDIKKENEIDLDNEFKIGIIKEIIHDEEDKCFYMVANKYDEKLGFFIIRMDEDDPLGFYKDESGKKVMKSRFLTKYKNKLDIGDCKLSVMREENLKELVISYKTIYINTYNIVIMDISQNKGQSMVAKHESFQLWESPISGVLLRKKNDFVTFNK